MILAKTLDFFDHTSIVPYQSRTEDIQWISVVDDVQFHRIDAIQGSQKGDSEPYAPYL